MFEQFIGTKPVEERHRIDVAALEKFLGFKVSTIEQFKGGQSNPTYKLVSREGRGYVLRRKPPGKLLPSAHAVDREYRVIAALHRIGFPVARPHVLCEDESVIGTAFYVMDYVEGRVLWDQSLPGMTKSERASIWDELNRVIALLHTIDFRKIGLDDFGKPGNYIERQIARWTGPCGAPARPGARGDLPGERPDRGLAPAEVTQSRLSLPSVSPQSPFMPAAFTAAA